MYPLLSRNYATMEDAIKGFGLRALLTWFLEHLITFPREPKAFSKNVATNY